MKDDYLWNKTGEDAEIERLENALAVFRYRETEPPELPQKVLTIEKAAPRRFLRLDLAFAAFASVVVVLSFVWFQTGETKSAVAETVAQANKPKRAVKVADESFINVPASASVKKVEKQTAFAASPIIKIRRKAAPNVKREKIVLRKLKSGEPPAALTAEEKYAVDQLLLALSITGEKLKIVKNKLNRTEEKKAVLETAK